MCLGSTFFSLEDKDRALGLSKQSVTTNIRGGMSWKEEKRLGGVKRTGTVWASRRQRGTEAGARQEGKMGFGSIEQKENGN